MANPDLRAYFLWGPFLRSDSEDAARKYQAPHAGHFWLPGVSLGRRFASVLRLAYGRVAWDVYLLYRRGVSWENSVPEPSYWQHQLEVLQGEQFNVATLERKVHEFLRPR